MDVRLLLGSDLDSYRNLCDEDCLSLVRDEADGFKDGCFGFGILDQQGRGRAILLAASVDRSSSRIVHFVYNEKQYPQDGAALLWMTQEYVQAYEIPRLEWEYLTEGENSYLPGWSKPRKEAVIYSISGDLLRSLSADARKFTGQIIPYQQITTTQWLDFLRERDTAVDDAFSRSDEAALKFGFGAIVDGRFVGYMRCSADKKTVVVHAYDALESNDLLPVFFAALYWACRSNLPQELKLYAYNERMESEFEQTLGNLPYRQSVWQMSEFPER